ncbi:DUF805 domain-containing protein [Deinococcus altitudinis]|uniref:DUF805 domain-containing protein n=1 Tax=Deinococcus altitudinis TaxID=468914 RepID=UPI003892678C
MNAYLKVFRNDYANFSGRVRRRGYWTFTLINGAIILLLCLFAALSLPAMLTGSDSRSGGGLTPLGIAVLVLYAVYQLAVIVPTLGLSVRRLHDAGFSGWLLLIGLIPGIGGIGLLVLTLLDSQPGTNRWGPNPKDVTSVV